MTNALRKIAGQLDQTSAAIKAADERLEQAKTTLQEGQQKHASLREERQAALAKGENVTEISARLKKSQEGLELAEDTTAGINSELTRLTAERDSLLSDQAQAIIQANIEQLKGLADVYNQQAEQLSKTVRKLFELRLSMKENPMSNGNLLTAAPGWGRTALQVIPKLYLPGEKLPADLTEQAFFDATFL